MKKHFWKMVLVLCLGAIVAMQGVWLAGTGKESEETLRESLDAILKKAVETEALMRLKLTPKGTNIKSPNISEDVPPYVALCETLEGLGYPLSLERLDSLVTEMLRTKGIKAGSRILLTSGNKVLQQSAESETFVADTLCSAPFPVSIDKVRSVRIILRNPNSIIYGRLGFLLLATFGLTALALLGLLYHIRHTVRERKASRNKDDFMVATSHDMRNPLATMKICAEALRDEAVRCSPEKCDTYLSLIENTLRTLNLQVEQHLTLYRMEDGGTDIHKEAVHLPELWEEVVREHGFKRGKKVTFHTRFETEVLWAQRDWVKHIFINLLSNSLKYSHDAVEITVTSESLGKQDIVCFRDNGIGIPKRFHKTIFKKYVRGVQKEFQNGHTPKGYGMGLSLVQGIMKLHGGKVSVQSEAGQGAEFVLCFPKQ